MKKALEALNGLERDGAIGRYAIGGAMGATFYVEPFTTFDLDIFVADADVLDRKRLDEILSRHGLMERFSQWTQSA